MGHGRGIVVSGLAFKRRNFIGTCIISKSTEVKLF